MIPFFQVAKSSKLPPTQDLSFPTRSARSFALGRVGAEKYVVPAKAKHILPLWECVCSGWCPCTDDARPKRLERADHAPHISAHRGRGAAGYMSQFSSHAYRRPLRIEVTFPPLHVHLVYRHSRCIYESGGERKYCEYLNRLRRERFVIQLWV